MAEHILTPYPFRLAEFTPVHRQVTSRTRNTSQSIELGPTLWEAKFETMALEKRQADALRSRLWGLRGTMDTFYARVFEAERPQNWAGQDLAGATVLSVSDGRRLRLAGLPPGLTLEPGDFFTVVTGSGIELLTPERPVTATSLGNTSDIVALPQVRPTIKAGQKAVLRFPYAEMRLKEDTLARPRVSGDMYRVVFSAMQVVR